MIHPRPLLGEPHRPDRPFLAINMIITVDGRAAVNGSAVGIGSSTDHRLMMKLRAYGLTSTWRSLATWGRCRC